MAAFDVETRSYLGKGVAADVGGDPRQPAVILMHGGGQTRHSWDAAMRDLLAAGYHVINLDARGHGESAWLADADYGIDTLAADLMAVIATLPARPALVGASMGGATLMVAAGSQPQPIADALVLVDIVPRLEAEGSAKIGGFMRAHAHGFATLDEAVDAVSAYNPHRPRPRDPNGLMKNLRKRADGRLYWHWDPRFVDHPRRLEPPEFAEELLKSARAIRTPTLLVRGLQSDIVSDAGVDELRGQMSGLEVCDVAGAGHMVVGDRNDAFNAAVSEFLGRHLPRLQ
jgi:pimeloyl-ACP methyl ester carboxylesterase